MKQKYNMDVEAAGSFFNFKFDYYAAKVYNINDIDKNIIHVEKQRFYDENSQGRGERLEDNYGKVYWENRLNYELQKKYPGFFKLDDIEKANTDIAYFTAPLNEGVSSSRDERGTLIPLKPEECILDVDLKANEFSEKFLSELLFLIKDIVNTQLKVDIVVTGKSKVSDAGVRTEKQKIINLKYDRFKYISSVEDLKKEISDF